MRNERKEFVRFFLQRLRGEAMEETTKGKSQMMAALFPLSDVSVAFTICKRAEEMTNAIVDVASNNSPNQIVISGEEVAVSHAIQIAQKEFGVKKAIKLNVSAAFHSRLMRDAAAVVERELNNVSLHTPVVPFISNVTANEESDPTRLRSLLVQQITQTIRWVDCVQTAITKKQIKFFLEVGPKRVLTGLIQQINSTVSAWSLGSVDDIRLFFEYIRKRNKTES